MKLSKDSRKKIQTRIAFVALGLMVIGIAFVAIQPVYRDIKLQKEKTKFYVDFPGMETAVSLTEAKRKWAIDKANQERCSCDCGYTLASCLKADLSCPLRETNLSKVKQVLHEAESRPNS